MYEMLIADDSAVERDVIRFLIQKNNLPFAVTEAVNGQQALELLQKGRFHVLFTDIKMPFIDGLELAKQVRRLYPDLQIVFFSGYEDFEYARQALSLRIVNYILKPVNPEEFRKTMENVLEELHVREESAQRVVSLQGAVRRSALLQLLNGLSPERLQNLYPHADLSFLNGYHRMMLIRMSQDSFLPWERVESLLPEDSQSLSLQPGSGLVLFGGQRKRSGWYQELAERICRVTEGNGHALVSNSFENPEEIHRVYSQLKKEIDDKTFFASDENAFYASEPNAMGDDITLKQIRTDILLKDPGALRHDMALLLESCRKQQYKSSAQVRYLCTKVTTLLLDSLPGDAGASFEQYAGIIQQPHFSGIEERLMELTDRVAEKMETTRNQSHAVLLAKQYIHKHYRENLGLNALAEVVHLSPRYLSSLFAEEAGIGINRYIKKVRMQKACELLQSTNMMVSEICEQVGYNNLSYFCKSFQEDFGMTPDKFRSLPVGGSEITSASENV